MTVIDEYIAKYNGEIKERLILIRDTIKSAAPEASEKISWAMPTFYFKGNLVHFAASKNHIGLYPGSDAIIAFADRLKDYKTSKGAIQFQNCEPVPYGLIRDITAYRVAEMIMRS